MRPTASHAFGMGAPKVSAPRSRIYAIRSLRCSAAPSIRATWIAEPHAEPSVPHHQACTAPPASERIANVSLYGIIADLRRKYPTPAATETLDLVVAELGRTRDNLREAVANLSSKPLPPGGKPVLDDLVQGARAEDLYDLDYGPDPYDKPPLEPLDEGTAGIGALMVVTSLIGLVLTAAAVYEGVNAIVHSGG